MFDDDGMVSVEAIYAGQTPIHVLLKTAEDEDPICVPRKSVHIVDGRKRKDEVVQVKLTEDLAIEYGFV